MPHFICAEPAGAHAPAMFVSDIHLDAGRAATTAAFLHCLAQHATRVDALYLLGDIFEYWAGDDDLDAPEHAPLLVQLADKTKVAKHVKVWKTLRILIDQKIAQLNM